MTDTRPLKERLEEEKAQIEQLADPVESMLAMAELKARIALMQAATHENTRNWKAQDKTLKEYRAGKVTGASGERFKNIEQAAAWIIQQGYIVSARSVRNHADKPGFPKKQKDGSFLQVEVAAYAAANWENPSKPAVDDPAEMKTAQRNELIAEQTRKLRLANEITEGNYILRSLVEQEFAARASFLKRDLFNLGPRFVDRLMDKFSALLKDAGVSIDGVNLHALVPDMEDFWDKRMAEHLHEYSKARGFIPEQPKGIDE